MNILCWVNIHRYRWQFVGSSGQPDDYTKECTRCGREKG